MYCNIKTLSSTFLLLFFLNGCSSGNNSKFTPPPPTLSDDASLSGLAISIGELSPAFQSATTSYTVTQGFLQQDLSVTATVNDAAATVAVNGSAVTSGQSTDPIELAEGANTITITVTAEDGSIDSYTITATRDAANDFAQSAYIKASNTDIEDESSGAIALFENTLVVGALAEDSADTGVNANQSDNTAEDSGAVYVFTRDAVGTWSQQAYIKASNTDAGDLFGRSVSIYGDTLAVGAEREQSAATGVNGDQLDNSADNSGAVYVFTRDQSGTWSQQAYIKASNTDIDDNFGTSVALFENTLAVGARFEDSSATGINGDPMDNSAGNAGAVYTYVRDQVGDWSQQAYVKASNADAGDVFGTKIALHGNTLAAAAFGEDGAGTGVNSDSSDNTAINAGAAYVFTRDTMGTWSEQAYIKSSNTEAADEFGWSIAIHEDLLAVGARLEDSNATGVNMNQSDNSAAQAGAVYVFGRDATDTWSQQAYLKASNTDPGDEFGQLIALNGNTLAVGARGERSTTTGINGDQTDNSAAVNVGAVYVFIKGDLGTWSQGLYLKGSNTEPGDVFVSPSIFENTLAVGAAGEASSAQGVDGDQSDNSAPVSGAVYVFQ